MVSGPLRPRSRAPKTSNTFRVNPMDIQSLWHRTSRATPIGANMMVTGATNVAIAAMGIVTGVVAARLLGPRGRGELVAIQTWPLFIAGIAMLGTPEALAYYSARSPTDAGRYVSWARLPQSRWFPACRSLLIGYP